MVFTLNSADYAKIVCPPIALNCWLQTYVCRNWYTLHIYQLKGEAREWASALQDGSNPPCNTFPTTGPYKKIVYSPLIDNDALAITACQNLCGALYSNAKFCQDYYEVTNDDFTNLCLLAIGYFNDPDGHCKIASGLPPGSLCKMTHSENAYF